jgi:hypothetical protein
VITVQGSKHRGKSNEQKYSDLIPIDIRADRGSPRSPNIPNSLTEQTHSGRLFAARDPVLRLRWLNLGSFSASLVKLESTSHSPNRSPVNYQSKG